MLIEHEILMTITATMPMKTIPVNGHDYLQRYYVGTAPDGTDHWLHRFLRADSERHLHSHPFTARSTILTGCYLEQTPKGEIMRRAGDENHITPETLHRIIDVQPNTWTLMKVRPERLPDWYFIDDNGNKEYRKSSPREWWKEYGPRI